MSHDIPDAALDHEVRRIMQLDDDRAMAEVTKMASNWIVEHSSDLEGSDGISGTRTIALAYRARLAAISDDKRWIGEVGYLALLRRILDHGQHRTDRTGTGTISMFGAQLRFDLREGFPLLSTKKVPFAPIVHEILLFLRGSTDINDIVRQIKTNPDSRRLVVSAWNVQFYVQGGCLDCQLCQRSADMALGVPFNIASYALLTEMVAEECGLIARYFIVTFGDAYVYLNHVDGVRKQLERTPLELPRLVLANKPVLEQTFDDVVLEGYQHHPPIRFEVSV
jgi:thymidylate synthase